MLWTKRLSSVGQQFHQYHRNKTPDIIEHRKTISLNVFYCLFMHVFVLLLEIQLSREKVVITLTCLTICRQDLNLLWRCRDLCWWCWMTFHQYHRNKTPDIIEHRKTTAYDVGIPCSIINWRLLVLFRTY
jgi:hypothetical protein